MIYICLVKFTTVGMMLSLQVAVAAGHKAKGAGAVVQHCADGGVWDCGSAGSDWISVQHHCACA
jgi:hypothetical protein